PQPDSPTIPSVFPFSTEKLTPSTAFTMPSSVRKYVFRSLTSRRAIGAGALRQPDPRIDRGVEEVDEQVEPDDHDRGEDDHPLDGGGVVVVERLNRGAPEARQAVDGLGEYGATEREPDVHTQHRHDGEHGVPKHVRAHDDRLRSALGARGADVVLVQRLD